MSYTLYSANIAGTNANGNSGVPRNQCAGIVTNNGSFPLTRADGTPLQLGDWVTADPTATFPFSIDGVVFATIEDTARFIGVGVWVSNVSFYQQTNSLPVANKITESISGNSVTQQAINQEFKQEILDLKVRSIRNVGYCGTTQPLQAMSGDIWYQTNASSPYGSDLPTSFPIQVYVYENNAWSSTTQNWEPNDNDLIINTNINIAFVWNDGWSPNNQSLSTTDDITINRNAQGQLQVPDGGITLVKIAAAAITSIMDNIKTELNNQNYPIGAVWTTTNANDTPAIPGTWQKIPDTQIGTYELTACGTLLKTNKEKKGWLHVVGQELSRSTYSALYNALSQSGAYVYNPVTGANDLPIAQSGDGSTTFRLPQFKERSVLQINYASAINQDVAPGLPDITGQFGKLYTYSDQVTANGCFNKTAESSGTTFPTGTNTAKLTFSFKASDSNSIYGASNTVAVKGYTCQAFVYSGVGEFVEHKFVRIA